MNLALKIPAFSVKLFLWLSLPFSDDNFVVVCKGYGDDWDYYTGLYWYEDKDLETCWYEDYQIWLSINKSFIKKYLWTKIK
ncbi:MAG: hypothetical protein NTX01_07175 [Candidatus Omnitrophica bacterium]|nr:hypothetical protein [Candidatus Omnitrophota bacterium]